MKTLALMKSVPRAEFNRMRTLTVGNLAFKVMNIFRDYIGGDEAISRARLFKKIFGHSEDCGLADELRWIYAKRAMHLLRQRTKCFIASERRGHTWYYFVIRTKADAQAYIDNLNNSITRMRAMQRKAMKSVEERWHSVDWTLDVKTRRLIQ